MRVVFEQVVEPDDVDIEDGGDAKIMHVDERAEGGDPDRGLFVKVQSWVDHSEFDQLCDKRVRVTVETLD